MLHNLHLTAGFDLRQRLVEMVRIFAFRKNRNATANPLRHTRGRS
jgi:hypothetical protein